MDNFEFIKWLINKYYPNNSKIRAELYDIWLCGMKNHKKLVYVDIQKWFKESHNLYNTIISDENYMKSFENRCRIYDTKNFLHYTYWWNSHNLWDKSSNKKMYVDEEIQKEFWYLRFRHKIPDTIKKDIEKYFNKSDDITLVWGFKDKCLLEILNTFLLLWYTHAHIDNKYTY